MTRSTKLELGIVMPDASSSKSRAEPGKLRTVAPIGHARQAVQLGFVGIRVSRGRHPGWARCTDSTRVASASPGPRSPGRRRGS